MKLNFLTSMKKSLLSKRNVRPVDFLKFKFRAFKSMFQKPSTAVKSAKKYAKEMGAKAKQRNMFAYEIYLKHRRQNMSKEQLDAIWKSAQAATKRRYRYIDNTRNLTREVLRKNVPFRVGRAARRFQRPHIYHRKALMATGVAAGITLGILGLGIGNRIDSAYQSAIFGGNTRRMQRNHPTGDLVFALHRVR